MAVVEGFETLDQAMMELMTEFPKQVGPSAVGAGLSVFVDAMKETAPRGKTGNLRRSPGKSVKRRSDGTAGKAGFDVGRKATKEVIGPHAHLYYLGTQDRYRTGSKGKPLKGIGGRYRPVENMIRQGVYAPDVAKMKRRTGRGPAHQGMQSVLAGKVPAALEAMANRATEKLKQLTFQF